MAPELKKMSVDPEPSYNKEVNPSEPNPDNIGPVRFLATITAHELDYAGIF
jgi:hypothetical protein